VRELGGRVEVVRGDIASLDVAAVVNAADASLERGGRVDAAIEAAAGPKLREECRAVGGCPPGEARLTGGYGLRARWVIHAVGPAWLGGGAGEARVLGACYTEALRLAHRNEIETVAFPALSTGCRRYPFELAARVAVRTVAAWLVAHELPRRVTFCCLRDPEAGIYRALLAGLEP
jgi:O-acetyl-ADP-ribose deacetylase (regulator of RNase III)